MGKTIFLSYANKAFSERRDKLCQSALNVGYDKVIALSPHDIENSDFWKDNSETLSQPRGAGYWLWKPYIILKTLKTLKKDDILVYTDAGRSKYYQIKKMPLSLIKLTKNSKQGYLLGPALFQHGTLKKSTKRDCLILLDCDSPEMLNRPMIQSTWNFWTPSIEAFSFLEKWLEWCTDPRCLTDIENTLGLPNYDEFKDHRHDQSILTLLAYKMNAPYLDFSNGPLFKIFSKRPQSTLTHHFLKRIDDAEHIISGGWLISALIQSYLSIKLNERNKKRISK